MKILLKNQQRHRPLDKSQIETAIRNILTILDQSRIKGIEISILFVGDRKMKQLNSDYRGIEKSTDVLSFEAGIPLKRGNVNNILGDIVINVPRAESQARTSETGFYDELRRLLIHGTLHLLGYDHDKSPYMARRMIKKEQEIFDALKEMDSKH